MSVTQRDVRYRVPDANGAIFLAPPWEEAVEAARTSVQQPQIAERDVFGCSLRSLRQAARDEILRAAAAYTRRYVDVDAPASADQALVFTGHQPELAHPGVWLKNFAASELAATCQGTAINLLIDVDLCRTATIAVPAGDVDVAYPGHVKWDAPQAAVAWEQRSIVDADVWRSFGQRAAEAVESFVPDPYLRQWWPDAAERGLKTCSPGEGIAQARHAAEIQWGRPSLQLPQSIVCQTESFRRFACGLLVDLRRFQSAHNEALAGYRRRRRIRNAAHPAPNLSDADGWIEAPLWIWTADNSTRRPLFAKRQGDRIRLTDQRRFDDRLPISADRDVEQAVQRLADWERRGVKIRSRALITTMFARLLVCDLFIHGVGGSRYDEVTDEICRQYFDVELTPFATLSGTLRLPIAHRPGSPEQVQQLRSRLRELTYHPEKFIDGADADQRSVAVRSALRDKTTWVKTPKTRANARQRHEAIASVNAVLAGSLREERARVEHALAALQRRLRTNAVLDSREYAFCLFPLKLLRGFLLDFSKHLP